MLLYLVFIVISIFSIKGLVVFEIKTYQNSETKRPCWHIVDESRGLRFTALSGWIEQTKFEFHLERNGEVIPLYAVRSIEGGPEPIKQVTVWKIVGIGGPSERNAKYDYKVSDDQEKEFLASIFIEALHVYGFTYDGPQLMAARQLVIVEYNGVRHRSFAD